MPILAEQTSLYPETLLNGFSSQPSERRWWALYTKARQEKALARSLLGYQIPFYLPLVKRTRLIRGRKFCSQAPLFSGYVFLYGSDAERVCALTTNRISRTLAVDDADRLRCDLRQVQQLIEAGAPLTVESRLAPGNRVRVRHGALAGLEGMVLSRRGQTRLLVSVDFLQQGASVEIDDYFLEPIC